MKQSATTTTCALDEALKYVSLGLRVFPLRPGTKIPATPNGVKDATKDTNRVRAWWTENPEYGVALAPEFKVGGACFLEFDQRPWLPAWAKEENQPKPITRLHKSGGKASPHYIFLHTEKSLELGNVNGTHAGHEWFSFRADGRYVVAPPSVHPDTKQEYTCELDVEPIPIPDWLVARIAKEGVSERKFGESLRQCSEDFDPESFFDWLERAGCELGIEDGAWIPFLRCPVAGRRHEGQGVRGCALFWDGGGIGFKCHAQGCPSNTDRKSQQSGIGYLVSFLSHEFEPYDGVIWDKESAEELAEEFGAVEIEQIAGVLPMVTPVPAVAKIAIPITDGGVCTNAECKSGHYRAEASKLCRNCANPEPDEPKPMPQVTIDYLKKNSEAVIAAAAAMAPKPEEVQEVESAAIPDYKAPKKMYPMPEECMYGWIGDFCRTLDCPLQVAYPVALAFFAGNGIPYYRSGGEEVRTNLNVCAIGPKGWGKSRTYKRIKMSFVYSVPGQIIEKYPGSEIGLVELLGGKKAKDEDEADMLSKSFLLYQDELRSTFTKAGIENSALPFMLNHLFSEDEYGTASKRGHYVCHPKLSIIGGLTCDQPGEFADVFGRATTNGTYDRFIFTETPEWEFDDKWKPVHDDLFNFRRPKGCRVPDVVFDMKRDWVAKNRESRMRLGEIALRIALVSASMNHDSEVSEECMEKALMFCEWQEAVRYKYRPSDMDSVDGKCQEAIERALKLHPSKFVSWRKLCKKYNLYRHGSTVLGRVLKAMIAEQQVEETYIDAETKEGAKRKRMRYVKLAD